MAVTLLDIYEEMLQWLKDDDSSKPNRLTTRQRLFDKGHLLFLSRQPQAGAAGAPILGHTGTHRVGAVAADKPSVIVCDH